MINYLIEVRLRSPIYVKTLITSISISLGRQNSMTFLNTILEGAHHIFKREGIDTFTEEELIKRLNIHETTYKELFSGKPALVQGAVKNDLERRERLHIQTLSHISNPIEGLMYLLQDGISYISEMNPKYILDMQVGYPEVWQIYLTHINTHYFYQISEILNEGIVQRFLRKDINIKLVAKIIIEQINMLFNPAIFPPEKFDLVEVFRGIFFYYLRGICTEAGSKLAEELFSKHKL